MRQRMTTLTTNNGFTAGNATPSCSPLDAPGLGFRGYETVAALRLRLSLRARLRTTRHLLATYSPLTRLLLASYSPLTRLLLASYSRLRTTRHLLASEVAKWSSTYRRSTQPLKKTTRKKRTDDASLCGQTDTVARVAKTTKSATYRVRNTDQPVSCVHY
eukprot:1195040-Prorocentrum_minimum.AAC.1